MYSFEPYILFIFEGDISKSTFHKKTARWSFVHTKTQGLKTTVTAPLCLYWEQHILTLVTWLIREGYKLTLGFNL